ncbi:hypothetical protein [Vannielia litorea]|uniref:Uncharacterized protein n=1 Tax=Vannielia litorea TaxID=1217970 RepID=A0A1N6EY07_9RHOB|nr:hypothetical protein [Vannielia litorea]SIN87928.1 hypothetical protein SAMN05444002_1200 [Vannielia litorea]
MPEYWPVFDPDDPAVMGDDYLDLALFDAPPFPDIFIDAGLAPLEAYIGLSQAEFDEMNEAIPEHMRRPYVPERDGPWFPPEAMLELCAALRAALRDQPELFTAWPNMAEHTTELLEDTERVFNRAVAQQVAFRISVSP